MQRYAIVLLFLAVPARAQDIPLSRILIDGEGWRAANDEFATALKKPIPAEVKTNTSWKYHISDGKLTVVATGAQAIGPREIKVPGLNRPSGLTLSADRTTLFVGDAEGKHIWAFRIENSGNLTGGDRYCPLRMKKKDDTTSGVATLATDAVGCIYAATPQGVQIFDPTGRLCGVLTKLVDTPPTAMAFGGPDGNMLYVAHGDQVFVRKLQVKGAK
jgi:enterochelin esterase family protein